MSLDLGLSSLETAMDAVAAFSYPTNKIDDIWIADFATVSLLNQINFMTDATMYRLYCADFNIECEYNDEDCAELASKFQRELQLYQLSLMKNLVYAIYDRWVKYADTDHVLLRLPPSAKTAMMNFISVVNKMAESEYTPHFVAMYGSIAEAHKPPSTYIYDVSDVQETITAEQFKSYCDIVKKIIVMPFMNIEEELDLKRLNTRLSFAQKVLFTILYMTESEYNTHRRGSVPNLVDNYIVPALDRQDNSYKKEYLKKWNARKGSPMAYALCATEESIDSIPVDADIYPITDTFRFVCALLFADKCLQDQRVL